MHGSRLAQGVGCGRDLILVGNGEPCDLILVGNGEPFQLCRVADDQQLGWFRPKDFCMLWFGGLRRRSGVWGSGVQG